MNKYLICVCFLMICLFFIQLNAQSPYSVIGDSVNLRSEPDPDSEILRTLKNATELKIIERTEKLSKINMTNGITLYGDWFKVELTDGTAGWIFSEYVGLNFGKNVNGMITIKIPVYEKNQVFKSQVIASLINGSLRSILSPTGELLLPEKISNKKLFLFDQNGILLGLGTHLSYSKKYNKKEDVSCEEGVTVNGRWNLNGEKAEKAFLGVSGIDKNASQFKISKKNITLSDQNLIIAESNKDLIETIKKHKIKKIGLENIKKLIQRKESFLCISSNTCSFEVFQINDHKEIIISTLATEIEGKPNNSQFRPKTVFRIDQMDHGKVKNLLFHGYTVGGDGTATEKLMGITDIDNNGVLELWTEVLGYESWSFSIYSLEKNRVLHIFSGIGGGC